MTFARWAPEEAREVLGTVDGPGPVLRALQAVQERFGFVPDDAVPMIAEHYNVSRADVYGVLTFYSDLRRTAPAAVEVRVCMGEACQSVGARDLMGGVQELSGPDVDVTHVYCLGNCALGPSATVNGRLLGRTTGDAVRAAAGGAR